MKTILLHGLGQTSSSWKNTINTMGKSADILCPNLFDWFEDKEVCYQVLYLAFSEYCKQFSEPVNICGLTSASEIALMGSRSSIGRRLNISTSIQAKANT